MTTITEVMRIWARRGRVDASGWYILYYIIFNSLLERASQTDLQSKLVLVSQFAEQDRHETEFLSIFMEKHANKDENFCFCCWVVRKVEVTFLSMSNQMSRTTNIVGTKSNLVRSQKLLNCCRICCKFIVVWFPLWNSVSSGSRRLISAQILW